MAYGKHYVIYGASKSLYMITCEVWEDGYSGSTERIDAAYHPFILNLLAQNDDVFSPILASELRVKLNVTDFASALPDFTSTDDRKYWVKLIANYGPDSFLLWQGFILNDNTVMPFSTGFIALEFSCTDGLAMLKNIPYEPTNPDINVLESQLQTVLNCLNKINLPEGFNLNVCTSTFAFGMNDRGTGTQYEPLSQAYYAPRNFLNSTTTPEVGVEGVSPYTNCYDVLERIMLSWGLQLKHSEGEFFITNRNEEAEDNIYFTKVDQDGTVIDSGLLSLKRGVVPYSKIANYFWIDNTQTKITRKGFPDIQLKCDASYASQGIDNGDMSGLDGTSTTGLRSWGKSLTGVVTVTSLGPYTALSLQPTGANPATQNPAACFPTSKAPVYFGDRIKFSFLIDGQATPSPTLPKVFFQVILTGPSPSFTTYWLDSSNNWVLQSGPDPIPDTRYYSIIGNTSSAYETISITTPPAPISGTLGIKFVCDIYLTEICTVANFIMNFESANKYRLIRNPVTNLSYRKLVNIPIGGASDQFATNQTGSLLNVSGGVLDGWYRYGRTEVFDQLMALLYQQYYNILSTSSINLDGNVWGLLPGSSIEPTQPVTSFEFSDSTGKLSVADKVFLLGNASFDYINNTVSLTVLFTSNTDLAVVPINRIIPK